MFRFYIGNEQLNLNELINKYRTELLIQGYTIVSSNSPIDHTAAYLAWQDAPGALIALPELSLHKNISIQEQRLLKDAEMFYNQDVMILTSSGTTSPQSLVVHSRDDVNKITVRSSEVLGFESGGRIGANVPPFTSGFYHIILQTSYHCNGELRIWNWTNDSCPDVDYAVFSAGQLDFIKAKKIDINLKKLEFVAVGASAVLPKHGELLVKSGAKSMKQTYGLTQIGTPFLISCTTNDPEELPWINLNANINYTSKIRFVDDEFQVKDTPIPLNDNHNITDDGWYKTGDLWQRKDNLIKFDVRNKERIKVNDYLVKISLVEETIKSILGLEDCMVYKKTRLGVDFLHLTYQSNEKIKDINLVKKQLSEQLPHYSIPSSFEKVEELPRTALGKKKRW